MNETEDLKRQIRVFEQKLKTANQNIDQLKNERSQALDQYYDEYALRLELLANSQPREQSYIDRMPCEYCDENQSQYDKIRSAFDRHKSERAAIIKYLGHYKFQVSGKLLSVSKMIREGKQLLQQD